MPEFRTVLSIALLLVWFISVPAFVYYFFRAANNRTPAAPSLWVNPWWAIGPEYLTERGKMYRRRCLIAFAAPWIFTVLAVIGDGAFPR
jgi:hypothetical protein